MIGISERDWKVFKRVRELALQRFCERAIADLAAVCDDREQSFYDRYHAAWKLMRDRDREMANAFDDYRRSTAVMQLGLMAVRGLVSDEDLSMFTPEVQDIISNLRRGRD